MALVLTLLFVLSPTGCCRPELTDGKPLVVTIRNGDVTPLGSSAYRVSRNWMKFVVATIATLKRENAQLRAKVKACQK